jgi:steroid delta-isomerase-like uncharacterized protein
MTTSDVVRRYFEALADHDLDAAAACWAPDGVDRFVGQEELVGPDAVRDYFANLFHAFPDFSMEIVETTTSHSRAAVRWRAHGTFAGPGTFQGFEPNGAWMEIEGCDVFTVHDGLITHNDAYLDTGAVARQLGFLPPPGSKTEARLLKLANTRTRIRTRMHGTDPEQIANGVWIVRGGFPAKVMNVYLIEDDGGVTVFDAGISAMPDAIAAAGARLGGIRRIVLGHADCDHRGSAPLLHAPVYCHPDDREAAYSPSAHRTYWDYSKLGPHGRALLRRLNESWDGGPVEIAGTIEEGADVAGFRVIHVPGHAPGLIALFREQDRLALVSDLVYTLDPQTGIKGPPRVPHPAFNMDTEQARGSIRKLAALSPSAVWPGHADPVSTDVVTQLEQAASAPLPA